MSNTGNIVITSVITAALSVGGVVFSSYAGFLNKDREHDIEMVRLSLQILKGEFEATRSGDPRPARTYAVDALRKYSGVSIDPETGDKWIVNGSVPGNIEASALPTANAIDPFVRRTWNNADCSFVEKEGVLTQSCVVARVDNSACAGLEGENAVRCYLRYGTGPETN